MSTSFAISINYLKSTVCNLQFELNLSTEYEYIGLRIEINGSVTSICLGFKVLTKSFEYCCQVCRKHLIDPYNYNPYFLIHILEWIAII